MKQTVSTSLPQSRIAITFDNPSATFIAGDVISGHVELDLKAEIRVKVIRLNFHGAARVSWDEQRAYIKGSAPVVSMKTSEAFLDYTMQIMKKEKEKDINSLKLPTKHNRPRKSICFNLVEGDDTGIPVDIGVHKYPFEFILPKNLPSTFDGKWGQICYGARLTVERPWQKDLERFSSFTVKGLVSFNDDADMLRPIAGREAVGIGALCCTGTLSVEVRVSRKGFVLGEELTFFVEVANESRRRMRSSKVQLVQHSVFRAGSKTKKLSTVVKSLSGGAIASGQSKVWENEALTIPEDIPPSMMRECKAIQVKYTLTVTVSPGGWADDFVLPIPIIIGSVPMNRSTMKKYIQQLGLSETEFLSGSTLLHSSSDVRRESEARRSLTNGRQSISNNQLEVPPSGGRRQSNSEASQGRATRKQGHEQQNGEQSGKGSPKGPINTKERNGNPRQSLSGSTESSNKQMQLSSDLSESSSKQKQSLSGPSESSKKQRQSIIDPSESSSKQRQSLSGPSESSKKQRQSLSGPSENSNIKQKQSSSGPTESSMKHKQSVSSQCGSPASTDQQTFESLSERKQSQSGIGGHRFRQGSVGQARMTVAEARKAKASSGVGE